MLCGGTFEDSISSADTTRRETQGVRARTATTRMGSSGAPIRSLVSLDTAPLRCETLWVRLKQTVRLGKKPAGLPLFENSGLSNYFS